MLNGPAALNERATVGATLWVSATVFRRAVKQAIHVNQARQGDGTVDFAPTDVAGEEGSTVSTPVVVIEKTVPTSHAPPE